MIKYKNGIRYSFSEKTWELINDRVRSQFTDQGPDNIEVESVELNVSDADLKEKVNIIELNEPEPVKKVVKRKPKKDAGTTQKN